MKNYRNGNEDGVRETINSMLLTNMARLIKQDEERKYPEKDHSEEKIEKIEK